MCVSVWKVSLFIAWSTHVVSALTYYCLPGGNPLTIRNESEGTIITRIDGQDTYGNDMHCAWSIDAGLGNKVKVTITQHDLQWSPQYSTCSGYDNMQIIDSKTSSGGTIASVCGARHPYSVISRGRYLYLKFSSTHQNFEGKKGIELNFKTFMENTCPPDWFQESPSSPDCLMLGTSGTVYWDTAQEQCRYSQSNLLTQVTEADLNAITANGKNGNVARAWIGLSDLYEEGQWRWVDQQPLKYKKTVLSNQYNRDCVAMNFLTGDWVAEDCGATQLNYICKAKKDGSTILYPSKQATKPPEEETGGVKTFLIVIIVVAVIIILLVGLLVYFYYRRKQGKAMCVFGSNSSLSKDRTDNTHESVAYTPAGPQRPSLAPSAPVENVMLHNPRDLDPNHDPQMVAPPTYEESRQHPIAPSYF